MTPIIEFKNYTFKYRSQSEPTLRDIDLRVNAGEKVLIVANRPGRENRLWCTASTGWFLFHTLAKAAEL